MFEVNPAICAPVLCDHALVSSVANVPDQDFWLRCAFTRPWCDYIIARDESAADLKSQEYDPEEGGCVGRSSRNEVSGWWCKHASKVFLKQLDVMYPLDSKACRKKKGEATISMQWVRPFVLLQLRLKLIGTRSTVSLPLVHQPLSVLIWNLDKVRKSEAQTSLSVLKRLVLIAPSAKAPSGFDKTANSSSTDGALFGNALFTPSSVFFR